MNNIGIQDPTRVPRKVYYMTIIMTLCSVLVIISAYYITLGKASIAASCNQFPAMMPERVPRQSTNEFKRQFKALYVHNKLQRPDNSNITRQEDLPVKKSGNGTNVSWQNLGCDTHETDSKTCQCSKLPDQGIFSCRTLLPSSDNIFFLETSCASRHQWHGPEIHLGRRRPLSDKQACSIYSAAHHNPSRKVILLFTCQIPDWFSLKEELKTLFDLQNFYFSRVDVAGFYANTSLSDFYHWELALSSFPAQHQADIFRLVVLYLYGGTYMDLDVISLKPLDDLGVNFVGHVKFNLVSNAVMNFEPGHKFVKTCLTDAILNYHPEDWSSVGPVLISRTLISLCNTSKNLDPNSLMTLTSCKVTVLPRNTFFAVMWQKWRRFYKAKFWPEINKLLNKSNGVHYWNHMGHSNLAVGSNQPIIKLAQQHCAPVYENSGSMLD